MSYFMNMTSSTGQPIISYVSDVALDGLGDMYVALYHDCACVVRVNLTGGEKSAFYESTDDAYPAAVAVDSANGFVYVLDSEDLCVLKLDRDGVPVLDFQVDSPYYMAALRIVVGFEWRGAVHM